MALLYKGESNTEKNPKLDLYTYGNDTLTTADAVRCRIFDISTDVRRNQFYGSNGNPAIIDALQMFPATQGTYCDLDVIHDSADAPVAGHKLGVGHYYVPWKVPENAAPGSYVIIWEFRFADDIPGAYRKAQLEFVISAAHFFKPNETLVHDVREYLYDYAHANDLVDGTEYTDAQIERALKRTIQRYNAVPPFIGTVTEATLDDSLQYPFLIGTAAHLLTMTSIQQLRNQLTYTDGGVHVGLGDKFQLYAQLGAQTLAQFDDMIRSVKVTKNMDACWGGIASAYSGYFVVTK